MTIPIDKAAESLLPSLVQRHPQALRKMQARAVFASIDTDELARMLWARWNPSGPKWQDTNEASRIEARIEAEAVKAHLLKEDA